MSLAYLGFGSNLGDRAAVIERGIAEISRRELAVLLRRSKMYETAPVGASEGGDFLNCAVEVMTDLEPGRLLEGLRGIEADLGRVRTADKNAPRTLDIDLLLYDYMVVNEPELTLPHPELHRRLFILQPLNDIRPDLFHPLLKKTVAEIMAELPQDILAQRIRVL